MTDLVIPRKFDMKRLLLAVAMTAFIVNSAQAAELRADAAVSGDVVTVGDVFAGVTHDADYVLAPAPAYGKTMTLYAADLKRISDTFNLGWIPQSAGGAQVTVRRSGQEVGSDKVEAALQAKLASEMKGRKFEMQMFERGATFHLPEGASSDLTVSALKYDLNRGEFRATITAGGKAQEVSGRLHPVTSVPVLKAALQQGEVISAEDIDYVDMRNSEIGANVLTDASKLVGMAPRRGLGALRPMTAGDLSQPLVVKKGEQVSMTLSSDSMTLTAVGKALSSGAVGDTVKIVNAASGLSVDAVVTGPKSVEVRSPDAGI